MAKVNKKKKAAAAALKTFHYDALLQSERDEIDEVLNIFHAFAERLRSDDAITSPRSEAAELTQAYCTYRLATTLRSIDEQRRIAVAARLRRLTA